MTYQPITVNNAENVGTLDRVNRFLVGMTLLTVAVLFTAISEAALAGLVAVGFYAGLTAFIGWDPLYALANSYRAPRPVRAMPPTSTAYHPRGAQPSHHSNDYQQAA